MTDKYFNRYSSISEIDVGCVYNFEHRDINFVKFIGLLESINIYRQYKEYIFSDVMRFDEGKQEWVSWKCGEMVTMRNISFGELVDENPH